LTTAI